MCEIAVGPARLLLPWHPDQINYGDCYVLGCFYSKKKRGKLMPNVCAFEFASLLVALTILQAGSLFSLFFGHFRPTFFLLTI